ncbi:hypothetical protein [Thioclava sp. F42-5]|uniref:hypothetical protein n=1 Tax=Thioclava sp. F42-5 TaxID=1973005 RepID=UPI0011BA68D0|nr:hypothetical protein [Thioclava sp. F42-5]
MRRRERSAERRKVTIESRFPHALALPIKKFPFDTRSFSIQLKPNDKNRVSRMAYHPNHITRILACAAMNEKTITYSELGEKLGKSGPTPGLGLGKDLYKCQEWLKEHDLPPLTLLVQSKQTGLPSSEGSYDGRKFGEMNEQEIRDLQQSCFSYKWSASQLKALGISSPDKGCT